MELEQFHQGNTAVQVQLLLLQTYISKSLYLTLTE